LWRDLDRLYITLYFPISPLSSALTVYRTLCTTTPLPQQVDHVTVLQNMPQFIALSKAQDVYFTFDSQNDWDTPNSLTEHSSFVFHHRHEPSCISSFLNHQLDLSPKRGTFAFMPDAGEPQIIHLEAGHLLLINISHYTLRCVNGSVKAMEAAAFVELVLPCECMFESEKGRYYPKLLQCEHRPEPITHIHPINRIALQMWFPETKLQHIGSDAGFSSPPRIPTASLQPYQSEYTQQVHTLHKTKLRLDTLMNTTKNDAVFFSSLAHKLVFDVNTQQLPIRASALQYTSWQNVVFMMSTVGTVLCAVAIAILYRKHLILVTTLAVTQSKTAAMIIPDSDLSYLVQNAIANVEHANLHSARYDVPVLDILVCILVALLLVLTYYYWYRRQVDPLATFVVYLEVGNTAERVHIPVVTLPTASLLYKFHRSTDHDLQILVHNRLFPILTFQH